MDDVAIIKDVNCNETIWLKIEIRSGVDLYVGCVYMPTQGNIKPTCTDKFNLLQKDIRKFQSKGRVVLVVDFNARVGKGDGVDDVFGMFGESICNSNGNM